MPWREGSGAKGCASAGTWLLPELRGGVRDGHLELLRSTAAGRGEQQVPGCPQSICGGFGERWAFCTFSCRDPESPPAGGQGAQIPSAQIAVIFQRVFLHALHLHVQTCQTPSASGKRKKKEEKKEKEIERAHEVTKPC